MARQRGTDMRCCHVKKALAKRRHHKEVHFISGFRRLTIFGVGILPFVDCLFDEAIEVKQQYMSYSFSALTCSCLLGPVSHFYILLQCSYILSSTNQNTAFAGIKPNAVFLLVELTM